MAKTHSVLCVLPQIGKDPQRGDNHTPGKGSCSLPVYTYCDILDGFRLKAKTKLEGKVKEFVHPRFRRDDPNSSCLIQLQVSSH